MMKQREDENGSTALAESQKTLNISGGNRDFTSPREVV
jgi:hypothetical protein